MKVVAPIRDKIFEFKAMVNERSLLYCARTKSTEEIQVLLDKGININTPSQATSPLYEAISDQEHEKVLFLLSKKAKVSKSCLNKALLIENAEIVQQLLRSGADVHQYMGYDQSGYVLNSPLEHRMYADRAIKNMVEFVSDLCCQYNHATRGEVFYLMSHTLCTDVVGVIISYLPQDYVCKQLKGRQAWSRVLQTMILMGARPTVLTVENKKRIHARAKSITNPWTAKRVSSASVGHTMLEQSICSIKMHDGSIDKLDHIGSSCAGQQLFLEMDKRVNNA